MTELELLGLLRSANDGVDANFQFWLSSIFAVLLAFYFTAGKMTGLVKWIMISLYIASTTLFAARLLESGFLAANVRSSLRALGSELQIYNAGSFLPIGVAFIFIIVLGTLATVYFCLFSERILRK